MTALVAISFFSFVTGTVLRLWPERVQRIAERYDGLVALLPPEAHRALVRACGYALLMLSAVALLGAAFLL